MFKKTLKSFGFAWQGIVYAFKTQRNFRFHLFAAALVVLSSLYFDIKTYEWLAILFCVALVLFAELVNTSIESIVDLVSPEYNDLAKIAKDTSAASVLVLAFFSAVVGLLVFIPYIIEL